MEVKSVCDGKAFVGNGSIYLLMGITISTDDFARGGNIFNGAKLFIGLKLGPNRYEGEIQDILMLPEGGRTFI